MSKYDLKFPIEVNGSTISSVTIRRPKGGDMVAIGDQVADLMKFYSVNAKAVQLFADAAATGEEVDPELIGAEMTPPGSKVFAAMIAIVGRLAGIGEAAAELDVTDLQDIAAKALSTGEAPGRGEAKTGGE